MKYLLDTCVISDFVKGQTNVVEAILSKSPADLFLSSITLMEIHYGLELNPAIKKKILKPMEAFLNSVGILPYDSGVALVTARIRAGLKPSGKSVGAYDILIASTALAHGLTMVTSNENEFRYMEDLMIENWRR